MKLYKKCTHHHFGSFPAQRGETGKLGLRLLVGLLIVLECLSSACVYWGRFAEELKQWFTAHILKAEMLIHAFEKVEGGNIRNKFSHFLCVPLQMYCGD